MLTRANFGNIPEAYSGYEKSRFVILPIPFEKTGSWMHGANMGPEAIIRASAYMELYDIETASQPFLQGIHTADPVLASTSATMLDEAYTRAAAFGADGKFVISIGGEHTVSLGPIRAHHEKWPGMSVLHLDAHTDYRMEFEGNTLSHACVMARVSEFCRDIVSVGIRSMDISERSYLSDEKIFYAHEIHNKVGWEVNVIDKLSKDVYVTIDLDVFDPGIMPSTGTPEPGGLTWYQVTNLLKQVAGARNIVGMDVVELCPSNNPAPDFLAAKLIYRIISDL